MAGRDGNNLGTLVRAVRESTLKRLRAVPDGFENWRPTVTSMSFADVARHLIACDRWLFDKLESETIAAIRGRADTLHVYTRKEFESLLEELTTTGEQRTSLLLSMSDTEYDRSIHDDRFGGDVSVWFSIMRGAIDHEIHHRGQLAVYLRLISET